MIKHILRLNIVIIITLISSGILFSQSDYTSEELFTIPWGEDEGEISTGWSIELPPDSEDMRWPPIPIAISESDGIVIVNDHVDGCYLTKYSINGSYVAQVNLSNINIRRPIYINISENGNVLCSDLNKLYYFNDCLQYVWTIQLSDNTDYNNRGLIWRIHPSNDNNFWCVYDNEKAGIRKAYLIKVFTDGTISDPTQIFEGSNQSPVTYSVVSPEGVVYAKKTDLHGYTYMQNIGWQTPNTLTKRNSQEEVVYTNLISNDPDCIGMPEYFVMWTGNYFTVHGSEEGMVVTKYTLQTE